MPNKVLSPMKFDYLPDLKKGGEKMSIQMIYSKDGMKCIRSDVIESFDIEKHGTMYGVIAKLKKAAIPKEMLYQKGGEQCIDSTLIMGFEIEEHSTQRSTKYTLTGKLHHDYGTFAFFFGLFDTLPEVKEFMGALGRQIEAESRR